MNLLSQINAKRDIKNSMDLCAHVKHVAVILTSSRSGSSLVKSVLDKHPQIASLSGEMEPFFTLSQNGFGFTSDSDAFTEFANRDVLLNNVFDDLGVPSSQLCDTDTIKNRWKKRFIIQFPNLFCNDKNYDKLLRSLDKSLLKITDKNIKTEIEIHKITLNEIFKDEPWRINYYDGYADISHIIPFDESYKIEEPPFVTPALYKRVFTIKDTVDMVLLFKTSSDCHRIGLYEQFFPNAEIKYIHLTRGFAQTINGLVDGWLSPIGFFAHDMETMGEPLDIKGYSDFVAFGRRWWKFDLPPNWRHFRNANLINVCANQWFSAHKAIMDSEMFCLRVHFENFIANPSEVTKQILEYLGLKGMGISNKLPHVMATEKPAMHRWRKREKEIFALGERANVKEMMESLGYTMNPKTWL